MGDLLYCVPDRGSDTAPRTAPGVQRRWRSLVWWLVAVVAIAWGYADLAMGGETLAPILLIAGYCIFVPVAILR